MRHDIPVVHVAVLAERHIELDLVVCGVGLYLAQVVVHTGAAKRGARQSVIDGVFRGHHADALRPLSQMRFWRMSVSYSSSRFGKISVNSRHLSMKSRGTSLRSAADPDDS